MAHISCQVSPDVVGQVTFEILIDTPKTDTLNLKQLQGISTWTPKVCRIKAFLAVCSGLELLCFTYFWGLGTR